MRKPSLDALQVMLLDTYFTYIFRMYVSTKVISVFILVVALQP